MRFTRLHLIGILLTLLVDGAWFTGNDIIHAQSITTYRDAQPVVISRIDFIKASRSDVNVMSKMSQSDLINPDKSAPSLIDELEFRLSNDELAPKDQRYDFRLRPNNPALRNRTKELYSIRKKQLQADAELDFSDEVFIRYEIIIDWLELQQELLLLNQRIHINEQRIDWLKRYPGADFFDADTYTEALMDKLELWSKRAELELSMSSLHKVVQQKMNVIDSVNINWDENFDISTDYIKQVLRSLPSNLDEHRRLYLAELAIQEVKWEEQIEKASVDIGFLQAEYFPNRVNKSLIGFSAGITLPLFQTDRAELMDYKLQSKEREFELLETRQQISNDVQRWKEHLQSTLSYYEDLRKNYEEINLSELKSTLQTLDEFEPLKGLELMELELKWKELEQEWYLEIVRSYIGLLSQLDWLASYTDIDWLSSNSVKSFNAISPN
ncbi:MAG: hypothetical protein EBR32_01270 [Bacteroidetes bacterium]|nr:hypothetical protein [Bacteroidota bacterium]